MALRFWNNRGILFKFLAPTLGIMMLTLGWMLVTLSEQTEKATVDESVREATEIVNRIKKLRALYTKRVVSRVKDLPEVKPDIDYESSPHRIPLPATFVHELNELISAEDKAFNVQLYSDYPFPNRANRKLDSFSERAMKHFRSGATSDFVEHGNEDGKDFIRVAVPDRLSVEGCVNCHNTHPLTPKNDWALGDVRGVLEVRRDLTEVMARQEALVGNVGTQLVAGIGAVLFVLLSVFFVVKKRLARISDIVQLQATTEEDIFAHDGSQDEIGKLAVQIDDSHIARREAQQEAQHTLRMLVRSPQPLTLVGADEVVATESRSAENLRGSNAVFDDLAVGGNLRQFLELQGHGDLLDRLIGGENDGQGAIEIEVGTSVYEFDINAIQSESGHDGFMVSWDDASERKAAQQAINDAAAKQADIAMTRATENIEMREKANIILKAMRGALDGRLLQDLSPLQGDGVLDEIGASLDVFLEKLRGDVRRLENSSEATAETSVRIRAMSDEIVKSSETTALATDSILHATSELTDNVSLAASSTDEFQKSIQEIASQSAMAAQRASEGRGLAHEARAKVQTLMECSRQVESISETINSIAEQTNLLALNATIEAARAGESGKGFAVVAHEVKELASGTGEATQTIADQTSRIRQEAEIVSDFIERMVQGVEQIDDAQIAIAGAMEEQTAVASDVAGAVERARDSSARVVGEAQSVAREAESAATTSRAANGAAVDLKTVVDSLNDIVEAFDVKSD